MNKTTNAINWFEIPVADMGRAKKFYETIFAIEMEESDMGDTSMAVFPYEVDSDKVAGALVKGPQGKPSQEGTVVYLNANPAMDNVLARVNDAGGKVVVDKMSIGEHGYIAFVVDTEGNKVGIHSEK